MILEQQLPQVLPLSRPMPLPDILPKVPDQPVPLQGMVNPGPLDIRLFGKTMYKNRSIGPELMSSFVEIAFVD